MSTKPRKAGISILLQLIALAIGPVVTAIDWGHLRSLGPIQTVLTEAVLTLFLMAYLIWKMSQGRNWARITLVALFLLGIPFFFPFVRAEFNRSATAAILSIMQALFQGTGLVLAFTAPGKEWFSKSAQALNS
jgi:hypothetical protein